MYNYEYLNTHCWCTVNDRNQYMYLPVLSNTIDYCSLCLKYEHQFEIYFTDTRIILVQNVQCIFRKFFFSSPCVISNHSIYRVHFVDSVQLLLHAIEMYVLVS
jgi:hypothetical protein